MTERDRADLQRIAGHCRTLGDLLDLLPVRLDHLRPALEELHDGAPSAERAAVGLDAGQDIDRWLSEHGMANLAEVPARDVAEAVGVDAWTVEPLRQALDGGGADSQTLVDALLAQDPAAQTERLARWRTPCRHASLRPVQQLLLDALEPGLLLGGAVSIEVCTDPPELLIGTGAVELDPPGLRRLHQLHVQAALEALDDLGEVAALLDMDGAERDLALLLESLAPYAPSRGDGELGWVLKDTGGRWSVVPVQCTPRKEGYRIRELKPGDPSPASRAADDRAATRGTLIGTLDELVGHPRVFVRQDRRCDGLPRPVRRAQLQVGLRAHPDGTEVRLEVDGRPLAPQRLAGIDRVSEGWWVHPTDEAILVAPVPTTLSRVHALLLRRGRLVVPDGAQLLHALPWLPQGVAVDVDPETLGRPVPADERPVLRLAFEGPTLHLEARVQPLPEAASSVPGEGSPLQLGRRGDVDVHLQRHLASEPERVHRALAPLDLPAPVAPFTWRVDDQQRALAIVERLRAHTERIRVHWAGDRPRLASRPATAGDLSLQVQAHRDWFDLKGGVTVDGHDVPLQTLLDAAIEGHGWVPMSDGQWLGIAEDLRQLLAAAAAAAERRGDEVSLRAVHAPLLDPLMAAGASLDAPPAWVQYAQRCREAGELDVVLPDTLQATLRPYQEEGVRWMLGLAHWAPGAVLADDMGLGKTIQTITFLLARADRPSLVVAPTSLLHNWQRELARFAPSLDVSVFHGPSRTLEVAAGRVVLTTYGVLVQDQALLADVAFGTVVYDEAHAVKNPSSQRARAASTLDAGFVLALSGTPVENRVADLWALFRVAVPGLLGTVGRFRERFVLPIEARGDTSRRATLAQLVAPFILRRTKRGVAKDLPERTEVLRRVVLSDDERRLYDRTRRSSLARLAGGGPRLQILEELLRLRKLACHPRLFDPDSDVPSSKLRAIRRLVSDVRESGQRMLLFSTFTSHLALIREALEADGVPLRYLDGSMSPAQRVAEVDAFQSGQGDVFLISTKAGGVGLNLTSATVVAHVDPWWNPTSEDQATDRAHRIGQTDPVTVVRFVAAGTIEEQIVALHATKRELADALLAHSGSTRPVKLDELVALLSDDPVDSVREEPCSTPSSPP